MNPLIPVFSGVGLVLVSAHPLTAGVAPAPATNSREQSAGPLMRQPLTILAQDYRSTLRGLANAAKSPLVRPNASIQSLGTAWRGHGTAARGSFGPALRYRGIGQTGPSYLSRSKKAYIPPPSPLPPPPNGYLGPPQVPPPGGPNSVGVLNRQRGPGQGAGSLDRRLGCPPLCERATLPSANPGVPGLPGGQNSVGGLTGPNGPQIPGGPGLVGPGPGQNVIDFLNGQNSRGTGAGQGIRVPGDGDQFPGEGTRTSGAQIDPLGFLNSPGFGDVGFGQNGLGVPSVPGVPGVGDRITGAGIGTGLRDPGNIRGGNSDKGLPRATDKGPNAGGIGGVAHVPTPGVREGGWADAAIQGIVNAGDNSKTFGYVSSVWLAGGGFVVAGATAVAVDFAVGVVAAVDTAARTHVDVHVDPPAPAPDPAPTTDAAPPAPKDPPPDPPKDPPPKDGGSRGNPEDLSSGSTRGAGQVGGPRNPGINVTTDNPEEPSGGGNRRAGQVGGPRNPGINVTTDDPEGPGTEGPNHQGGGATGGPVAESVAGSQMRPSSGDWAYATGKLGWGMSSLSTFSSVSGARASGAALK